MRLATGGRVSAKRPIRPYYSKRGKANRRYLPTPFGSINAPRMGKPTRGLISYPGFPRTKYEPSRGRVSRTQPKGAGSTKSFFTIGKKFMSKTVYNLFKQNQDWTSTRIGSFRLQQELYGRAMSVDASFYSVEDFINDLTLAQASTPVANQIYTSELFYGNTKVTTTFTNSELTTTYVKLYELQPRFHITTIGIYGPLSCWNAGIVNMADAVAINPHQRPYMSPFDSEMFTRFWKVDKTISFALAPGESHEHVSTYYHNKGFHGTLTQAYDTFRGMSHAQMITASGTPINDNTSVMPLVSSSTVALNCVRRVTRTFTYAPQLRTRYTTLDTLPLSASLVGPVKVISDAIVQTDTDA